MMTLPSAGGPQKAETITDFLTSDDFTVKKSFRMEE
jgi:hypothetical protein